MTRFRNMSLPVGQRPCPRCHGEGHIPLQGGRYEEGRAETQRWARSFDRRPVLYRHPHYWWTGEGQDRHFNETDETVPGVAVAFTKQGGYGGLGIYLPNNVIDQSPYREHWYFGCSPVLNYHQSQYISCQLPLLPFTCFEVTWTGRDRITPMELWDVTEALEPVSLALGEPIEHLERRLQ